MDYPEHSLATRKAELIRALDHCRRAMETGADEVASALDLPGQFRASFASSRWQWLSASLVAGVVAGFALSSRAKRRSGAAPPQGVKAPLGQRIAKALLQTAFETVGKPALQSMLQGRTENWLWRFLDKSGS